MPLERAMVAGSVRFGNDFDLDCNAGKLRRSGRVLKLERIPTEILLFLVQQRGEIVSREQIVEKIWGKDVHLDTDNSINGAIRKIRQVLRDDPDEPRFIQTVTGKGYRFFAPVGDAGTAEAGVTPGATEEEEPAASVPEPSVDGTPAVEPAVASARPRRWPFLLAAATVLVFAVAAYFRWATPKNDPLRSGGRTMLAVLPFENLTGDANQDYFSDGMTEEMITALGTLDPTHVGVIARTSVMHYKRSSEPMAQIARELGVQYVLEGSVRRDSDKVRITAQLIQMKDQTHLWARQYDRESKDLLVLQSEIAREITDEIQTALGDSKPIPAAEPPMLSPRGYEAYNLYLKGLYFLNKRTIEGFRQAIEYFQQATTEDPNDARAYAGLADSYALMAGYSGAPPAEFASKARAAALRALQLDDKLPEAHAALALVVQNHDYDWQTAEKEFKRAIELNPNYATAHHWYAEHLMWRGRFEEALGESERARELDPLSLIIAADNGATLFYARQYDKAIIQFTAVRDLDPQFPRAALISSAYIQEGKLPEAMAVIEEMSTKSAWHWSMLSYVQSKLGKQKEAEAALRKLVELNQSEPVDPMVMVPPYVGLGENNQAIAWLEKSYTQHSNGLTALNVDPIYDSLRADPRFKDLLRRVGFGR